MAENARANGGTIGVPTVFIHGFSGGSKTFDSTISSLENSGHGKLTNKYTVSFDGVSISYQNSTAVIQEKISVTPTEDYPVDTSHPLVQVVLANNTDYLDNQAKALEKVLDKMEGKYGTKYVNLVGHSMGGVASTRYILNSGGEKVLKLVTLGSPITSEFKHDLMPETVYGRDIDKMNEERGNFNKNIKVMSVAGTLTAYDQVTGEPYELEHDGVVSKESAHGLSNFTNNFTPKKCENCYHTEIQSNSGVINEITNFLGLDQ
nr:alpha/beta fold hydrolase [Effusibacillus lacus]